MKCDICNKNEIEYRCSMNHVYSDRIMYLCNVCIIEEFAYIQFVVSMWRLSTS